MQAKWGRDTWTREQIDDIIDSHMVESTYRQYLDGTIMQSVSNDTLNPRGYALPFGPMIPYNDTLIEIKKVGE